MKKVDNRIKILCRLFDDYEMYNRIIDKIESLISDQIDDLENDGWKISEIVDATASLSALRMFECEKNEK